MKLLFEQPRFAQPSFQQSVKSSKRRLIAVFGTGLIGTAIVRALGEITSFTTESRSFRWSARDATLADAQALLEWITGRVGGDADARGFDEVMVLWSAGRAGFAAADAETTLELEAFRIVLDLVERLHRDHPDLPLAFHLVSSLGGLFEGMQNIDASVAPAPTRAYGRLKLAQERLLEDRMGFCGRAIYRPSSVYDFLGAGYRMGLIPTLVRNGMLYKVSTIVGEMSTQRDYILASDVGRFIARQMLTERSETAPAYWFLASGKPSTIHEVQNAVESRLGRRIFICFEKHPGRANASDITVGPAALPSGWSPTDLVTGISLVTERMYRRGALAAPR